MRYLALATDYDETLARHGHLADSTVQALERFRASGRKTILVTGREIPDLRAVCHRLDLFDLIIGENGAVLVDPKKDLSRVEPLADTPPPQFARELSNLGVSPLSCGSVIVATLSDQYESVRSTIERLGLNLQIILNKGSLMVLPTGVNKASGLRRALEVLNIPAAKAWAIGDAENDIDFLMSAGCPAAVANALPSVKEKAIFTATREAGQGVEELISKILSEDA
ncbi:MAG: HAD family hydrolase [Bdellovibrionia bacterium]